MNLPILPDMKCDRCGDCCTIVLVSEEEYQKITSYAQANCITPKKQGLTCPFYLPQEKRCAVYEVRPRICRMFGHAPTLVCANGHNTNVSGHIEKRFMGDAKDRLEHCLHEAAGFSADQLVGIVSTFGVR